MLQLMSVVNLILPRDVYWRIAQFIRIFDFNGVGRLGTTEVRTAPRRIPRWCACGRAAE